MAKRPEIDLAHASQEISKLIEKCGYEGYSYSQIFDDFLTACEIWLDRLPSMFNQAAHQQKIEDPPDIAERWKPLEKKYKQGTLENFAKAFGIMLEASYDGDGNATYQDMFGDTYMAVVCPSDQKYRGQFFTPWNIAKFMAQMSMDGIESEIEKRLDEALSQTTYYQVGVALGLDPPKRFKLETKLGLLRYDPTIREHLKPVTICDPAVGSGILLLAAASCCPRWAIEHRLVEFYGQDIDQTCVQMAKLNMRLYGMNGWQYELRGDQQALDEFNRLVPRPGVPLALPAPAAPLSEGTVLLANPPFAQVAAVDEAPVPVEIPIFAKVPLFELED